MKRTATLLITLLLSGLLPGWFDRTLSAAPQAGEHVHAGAVLVERTEPWSEEVRDLASRIAVQENGRIKPLSTVAAFKMLRINGKRFFEVDDEGTRLKPIEWLLDCLFHPEQARHYETILLEDRDLLDLLGLPRGDKRKRDWYSYAELLPAADRLMELWTEYDRIDESRRTTRQSHLVRLAQNFAEIGSLLRFMGFAELRFPIADHPGLREFFPDREMVPVSQILTRIEDLLDRYRELMTTAAGGDPGEVGRDLFSVLNHVNNHLPDWDGLALIPPPPGEERWFSPSAVADRAARGEGNVQAQLGAFARLEELYLARGRAEQFAAELAVLQGELELATEQRGEYGKIGLEVAYYRSDFFFKAQWLFVVGFLLTVLVWLRPGARWLYQIARWWLVLPLLLVTAGIVVRCVLRGRPPVSTLYETILFITAVAVLVALLTEFVNRQRVAQSIAALVGAVGMFLAAWFEQVGGEDTMPRLQAVLDTNFWLSTHVTSISMGYSAGFLAAALAHVYVLGKLFGLRRDHPEFYRGVARMVYGAIAFGLVFSTVGTILGGIWANESWGRFWGWDPKENGALMIVLANLIILHGRLGGYLRDHGLCLAAVFLGTIVAFSWFHTNLLGVGLHSYGFNKNLHTLVWTFYRVEWSVLAVGMIALMVERRVRTAGPPASSG